MGAWGPGSFENEAAMDWALECTQSDDLAFAEATLDNLLAAEADELDASDAEEAIAAAAIVARARGRDEPDPQFKALDEWIGRLGTPPGPALIAKAGLAVRRIRNEPSELHDLWTDSGSFQDWQTALDGLLARLG